MPKAIAEKALMSILDLVSGRSWTSPEAAAVVARLVRLLPQPGEAGAIAATGIANTASGIEKVLTLQKNYWWLWMTTPPRLAPSLRNDPWWTLFALARGRGPNTRAARVAFDAALYSLTGNDRHYPSEHRATRLPQKGSRLTACSGRWWPGDQIAKGRALSAGAKHRPAR